MRRGRILGVIGGPGRRLIRGRLESDSGLDTDPVFDGDVLARRLHHEVASHQGRASLGDLVRMARRMEPGLGAVEAEALARKVSTRVHGLGAIDSLMSDSSVSEIMINGPGAVVVERRGRLYESDVSVGTAELHALVDRLLTESGRRVDRRSPMVDSRLPDGSRVNIAVPPVAVGGPYVTIRRFVLVDADLSDFGPEVVVRRLERAVTERWNILVLGPTGSGKTTLLNAIGSRVDPACRMVVMEDAAELRITGPHVVRLEAQPSNMDSEGEVTMGDLLVNALRMRPDRLVVGEIRGSEAVDLIHALSTGHRGSLATIHASGPLDALRRIELLAAGKGREREVVAAQIRAGLDLMVEVERLDDGRRRVRSLAELSGSSPLSDPEYVYRVAD